jgi:hypothetical protein
MQPNPSVDGAPAVCAQFRASILNVEPNRGVADPSGSGVFRPGGKDLRTLSRKPPKILDSLARRLQPDVDRLGEISKGEVLGLPLQLFTDAW